MCCFEVKIKFDFNLIVHTFNPVDTVEKEKHEIMPISIKFE